MSVTVANFKQKVGFRLGIIRSTENLKAQDAQLIQEAYESLYDELDEESLVDFYVGDPIPDKYVDILVGMVAARCVDDFGIEEPRKSSMILRMGYGNEVCSQFERRLRRMAQVGPQDEPLAIEHY